jgi:hypothetical protein
MKIAHTFAAAAPDEIKAALSGGKLVIYSVARPANADVRVERSGVLATFTFAAPAFNSDGIPAFEANPVKATGVGTPGFARAFQADGTTVVADFSVGPGNCEIKLSEVSTTADYPIAVTKLALPLPVAA